MENLTDDQIKLINTYYEKCDFDDDCDVCDYPEQGTWAVGYTNDENGEECDSYICGKCALIAIPKIIAQNKEDEARYDHMHRLYWEEMQDQRFEDHQKNKQ